MFSYCIHGLNLRSAIPLKEAQDSFSSEDLSIQLLKQRPSLPPALQSHLLKSSDHEERALICKYPDGGISIDYFDCGFFYYKDKKLQICSEHRDQDFFEAILTTQILPLISSLFRVTLHGGVVVKNQKAIIYLGQEGVGKSTLTFHLSQRGYPIWSDDVAAIQNDLRTLPGLPEIRVNDDSAYYLLSPKQIKKLKQRLAKHQILTAPPSLKSAELSAIFILHPQKTELFLKKTQLTIEQSFSVLIENQFRLDLWNPEILKTEFNTLTSLCEKIPFFRLDYPFHFESLPWIEQQIERSLHEPQKDIHCL